MAPQRTRPLAAEPKQRPSLSKLTEAEINECLMNAFASLSEEDQGHIKVAIRQLLEIRNVGLISALRVLLVTTFGKQLDQLDAALTHSVPQDG